MGRHTAAAAHATATEHTKHESGVFKRPWQAGCGMALQSGWASTACYDRWQVMTASNTLVYQAIAVVSVLSICIYK
jgi:hypothetical protein